MRAAIVPAMRATPLGPAASTCLLGCAPFVALGGPTDVSGALTAAIVITAVGAGFALDDTAATTLEALPTTVLTRRALRLLGLLAVLSVGISLQLVVLATRAGLGDLPVRAWMLQDAAFVAVTLMVSAVAQRALAERSGGAASAPTGLLLLLVVGSVAQLRPWITPIPGAPHWDRWGYVLAAGGGVLLALSRDAGAPRRTQQRRTARLRHSR